ncbi:MAG: chromosome partitioning protein ParB [Rubrivivax sp.]|nr:chromosome partitioning protein ParB [Rubrivivax sp.]
MSTAAKKTTKGPNVPFRTSTPCPIEWLRLDLTNPRLQTGDEYDLRTESELITILAEISALDELVLSICTNTFIPLEPLIVHGPDGGPYTVLEGNRRLASIKLINDPVLADEVGIRVPRVTDAVRASIAKLPVYRVRDPDEAREFIGFKHINGPQRWDAYAKARYVTDWYRQANGSIGIDEIADKMGDNNQTLRSYIYAVLMLDQAEVAKVWEKSDRPPVRGRFGFSHLYTAITRAEFQRFLGMTDGWSNTPSLNPIKKKYLPALAETLTYLYGSKSAARAPLIKSQNPDLKDLGGALVNDNALQVLRSGGTLEEARDAMKDASSAFEDALTAANLRLNRALVLMTRYTGGKPRVEELVEEIYTAADMLKTMTNKRASRIRK